MKTHLLVTFVLALTLALPVGSAAAPQLGPVHSQGDGLTLANATPLAPNNVVLYAAPSGLDSGACDSWLNACTLSYALSIATNGDEIWVKAGVHKPGTARTDTFAVPTGVEIYGGFDGTETSFDQRDWHANVTVLSGDIDDNDPVDSNGVLRSAADINGANAYNVVTIDTAVLVVVDGLVITAGFADEGYWYGGGMVVKNCNPRVSNVIFSGNATARDGGGMLTYYSIPTLANVVFIGNMAAGYGGAMYNYSSDPTLINATFSDNSATYGGGMYNVESNPWVMNSIMWNDHSSEEGPEYYDWGTSLTTFRYSDVQQGSHPGYGNICADPLFTDVESGNLRPQSNSPVIDAGSEEGVPVWLTTDLDGNPRFSGPEIDMGAYEFYVPDLTPPTVVSITRLDPNPTSADSVRFAVAFSEYVTGVDASDFSPTVTGSLSGVSVSDVSGHGSAYNVTVSTGTGTGTLRLDVPTGATITDRAGNPLGGLPYQAGEVYTVERLASNMLYAAPTAQGSGDCSSWANACTLATALAGAGSNTEIWVKAGVYYPTTNPANRTAAFALKNSVAVYGGFAGTETSRGQRNWQANVTILSGDIDHNDVNTDGNSIAETAADIQGINSYHVISTTNLNASAVLDGFVITAGQADAEYYSDAVGGGMYIKVGSPTLANLTFSGNMADFRGGGMCYDDGEPALSNVVFVGNEADYGGGIFGITDATLTNVTFADNTAHLAGGGMHNYYGSPTLINVTFRNNTATRDISSGGGMYNWGASPVLLNVAFSGNTAGSKGGGMYNDYSSAPTLTNVTLSGNTAAASGGGMYNDYSSPSLTNCILWGNSAPNGPQIYNLGSSNPTVTYSDVQGGYAGAGNIDANPRFVNAAGGDLRLQPTSPAIDAGNNAAVPAGVTTDLDGNPRFVDVPDVADTGLGTPPIVDMGAYEFQQADTESPTMPNDPLTGSPLITPTLGVTVHTSRPFFDWTDGEDNIGVVSYTLVITGPGTLVRAASATVYQIATTESEYTPAWNLPNGVYSWSVRAHDAAGNSSLWVEPQSFTVDAEQVFLPLVLRNR